MKMLFSNQPQQNLVKVQDVFITVPGKKKHIEYNNTLNIRSSTNSFWTNDEVEYKIETENYDIPTTVTIKNFSFSKN